MPKLRVLSGREVLKILHGFGFQKFAERGSHVKVRRVLVGARTQTLTVPIMTRSTAAPSTPFIARHADSSRSPKSVPSSSPTECGSFTRALNSRLFQATLRRAFHGRSKVVQ